MKRGMYKQPLSEQVLEWAYEKWLDGYSLQEVADALNVTREGLDKQLKVKGYVKLKPPLKPPKDLFD